MRGRVNTRFVIILIAIVVAAALAVIGVRHFRGHVSPAELIAAGDNAAAQSHWKVAAEDYARAQRLVPADPGVDVKLADALQQDPVDDLYKAQRQFVWIGQYYQAAFNLNPANPRPLEKLFLLQQGIARDLNEAKMWNTIRDEAATALTTNHGLVVAQKFRGIAQVNRMMFIEVSEDDRRVARSDLEASLKADPDDADTVLALAKLDEFEARLAQNNAQTAQAQQLTRDAVGLTTEALARHPREPRRQVDQALVLFVAGQVKEGGEVLDRLDATLLAHPDEVNVVVDAARLLVSPGTGRSAEAGAHSAETLLRAALAAHPRELRYKLLLANLLSSRKPPTQAIALYRELAAEKAVGDTVQVFQVASSTNKARSACAQLLLDQAQGTPEGQARQSLLDDAQGLIAPLAAATPDSYTVNWLTGQLKLLRHQPAEALILIDKASVTAQDRDVSILLASYQARKELGEFGAAIDRLNRVLELRPDLTTQRLELIQLEVQAHQTDAASQQLDIVRKALPNDLRVALLQAAVFAEAGQGERAAAILGHVKLSEHPEYALLVAQLYLQAGQPDEARRILTQHLDGAPTDVTALGLLTRIAPEKAQGYLEAGVKAGISAADAAALRSLASGAKPDAVKLMEAQARQKADPFDRHMTLYRVYLATGRAEDARAELGEAAKLKPNDPLVIDAQWDRAIAARDWTGAEALATRAGKLNLDLAQGDFYMARLEAARGRYDQAQVQYNRALAIRPVFSSGWQELGEVLRRKGDLSGAAGALQRAIAQRPDNLGAYRGLAGVQDAQSQHLQALDTLRAAYQVGSGDAGLTALYLSYEQRYGDPERALKVRRDLVRTDPGNAENRRQLAMLLAGAGRHGEAIEVADELCRQTPTTSSVAVAAVVRAMAGKPEEGRKLLEGHVNALGDKAVCLDWMLLGRYLLTTGQAAPAEAAYARAIALEDHKEHQATRELANYYFDTGATPKALELYQKLVAEAPDDRVLCERCIDALVRSDKLDEAGALLSRIESKPPMDSGMALLEAAIAAKRKDMDKALAAVNHAIELDPGRALCYYERGLLETADATKLPRAVDDLRKAVELEPDMVTARRTLGGLLAQRGELDEAIDQFDQVLDRAPQDKTARIALAQLYVSAGRWAPLDQLLDQSARMMPADATWPQLQAQAAALEGHGDVAIQKLRQVYTMAPSPQALGALAGALNDTGHPDGALAVLAASPDLVSKSADLQLISARALAGVHRVDEALATYKRVLAGCTSNARVMVVAGQMAGVLGQAQAIKVLEAEAQGEHRLWLEMAAASLQLGDGQAAGAIQRLNVAAAKTPPRGDDLLEFDQLRGVALEQTHDYDGAEAAFKRVLKERPEDRGALNSLAYLLTEDLNKPEQALPLAQKAAELAPEDPDVLDTLGWVQWKTGQADNAYDSLRRSVAHRAEAANSFHLGEVLYKRGDRNAALESYVSARRLAQQAGDQRVLEESSKRLKELGWKDKS